MEPQVGRPAMPDRWEYGSEPSEAPDLQWSQVRDRIAAADVYWLATTRPDGRPHVVPIGGVWADDALYLTLGPTTVSARNAARNRAALVHLEDANDAVIVEGTISQPAPPEVPAEAAAAYGRKYEGTWDPADTEMPYWVLRPRVVMTWRSEDIKGSAVRWRFASDG
jgi:nitroimidazol reductase NimA-like FMN-containing flavoprotein (pyridoxamine 5'-phosphate oxidase superfamily)